MLAVQLIINPLPVQSFTLRSTYIQKLHLILSDAFFYAYTGSMRSPQYKIYTSSGAAWDAMRCAIGRAKHSIYWEVYILVDDEAGQHFFDLLEKKGKEGVEVKLILDGFGSFSVSRSRIESLRKAGVDVRFFHERKHRYRGLWSMLVSRTHRKILIIDERVGFIGGVNVRKHMKEWKDIHVRIKGRVVHSLLRAFAKMYLICGGDKKEVRHLLKYKARVKQDMVDFIYDDSHKQRSVMKRRYTEALLKARERVILFSPYYFPGKDFLRVLSAARRRGVRIDLLIPLRTDLRIATYAAHIWFSVMAKAGVNIHLTKDMMHGKGVVVDDDWAIVGSSNIDQTSFHDNYEANIKIADKKTVRKLRTILLGWIQSSDKLDLKTWEKRSFFSRVKEYCAHALYKIWHRRT